MTTNFVQTVTVFPNGQATDKTIPAGINGQVLSCDSTQPSGFSFVSQTPLGVQSINAGNNISVTGTATNPTVGIQNPLIAPLNVGQQDITGTIGTISLTNAGNGVTSITATQARVADALVPTTYGQVNKSGLNVNTATDTTSYGSSTISKTGAAALTISTSAGPISINSATTEISVNSNRITNVADPTNAQDASTRSYTLSAAAAAVATPASNINLTNTYKVINSPDPTNPQDAATKNYVDTKVATPGTNINLANTYRVQNMPDPLVASDGANKNYVDSQLVPVGLGIRTYNDANARDAAIPSPPLYSWSLLRTPEILQYYDGSAWVTYDDYNNLAGGVTITPVLTNCSAITTYLTPAGTSTGAPVAGGTTILEIHTTSAGANVSFTSSGNQSANMSFQAEYLVVAGGGGGACNGGSFYGGGGGAGGLTTGIASFSLSTNVAVTYPVTVGLGGAGGSSTGPIFQGTNGQDSILTIGTSTVAGPGPTTLTMIGGGGGGYSNTVGSGGSGGGGSGGALNVGGAGTAGQGYSGGTSSFVFGSYRSAAGGGAGGSPAQYNTGGAGITSYITGSATGYAGGGSGQGGTASSGGGAPGVAGLNGTGGGGGCASAPMSNGGAGGRGVILLRFPSITPAIPADTLANTLIAGNSAGSNQINMNSNKIVSCADPTSAQDVATKNYVDTRPAENLSATLIAGNSAGSNQINMNSNKIVSCADPTSAQDVATKNYVDTRPAPPTENLTNTLAAGNSAGGYTITQLNNLSPDSYYNWSVVTLATNDSNRNALIPSPYSGQFCYLKNDGRFQVYTPSGWGTIGTSVVLNNFSVSTSGTYYLSYFDQYSNVVPFPVVGGFTCIDCLNSAIITVNSGVASQPAQCQLLLVVGGGGGAGVNTVTSPQNNWAGGGGAGAYNYVGSPFIAPGNSLVFVTVGAGGAGSTSFYYSGTNGNDSYVSSGSSTFYARGGGGGSSIFTNGNDGGCGGGGWAANTGSYTNLGGNANGGGSGLGLYGYGNAGAAGSTPAGWSGGGGGGGSAGNYSYPGSGSTFSVIPNASIAVCGGGAGSFAGGLVNGGYGGGGSTQYGTGGSGLDGTGGGGGCSLDANGYGGNGGSGRVQLRFDSYNLRTP